jgi:hypothetical protein
MVVVYAVVQSYINSDTMIAPKAKLDDGNIWLMFVRGEVSKPQLVKVSF